MADLRTTVRDATYTLVGLGVLGFQRTQLRRRQVMSTLARMEDQLPAELRRPLEQARRAAHDLLRDTSEAIGLRPPPEPDR